MRSGLVTANILDSKHLFSVISSNYVAPLNVCSCPACIFKLIFQRVIDFIAEEWGNLGSWWLSDQTQNQKLTNEVEYQTVN